MTTKNLLGDAGRVTTAVDDLLGPEVSTRASGRARRSGASTSGDSNMPAPTESAGAKARRKPSRKKGKGPSKSKAAATSRAPKKPSEGGGARTHQRTTIDLPVELHTELKILSVRRRMAMNDLIIDAVRTQYDL